ncbi:hypothetical protein ABK040_001717 [Willaertia magna]
MQEQQSNVTVNIPTLVIQENSKKTSQSLISLVDFFNCLNATILIFLLLDFYYPIFSPVFFSHMLGVTLVGFIANYYRDIKLLFVYILFLSSDFTLLVIEVALLYVFGKQFKSVNFTFLYIDENIHFARMKIITVLSGIGVVYGLFLIRRLMKEKKENDSDVL